MALATPAFSLSANWEIAYPPALVPLAVGWIGNVFRGMATGGGHWGESCHGWRGCWD